MAIHANRANPIVENPSSARPSAQATRPSARVEAGARRRARRRTPKSASALRPQFSRRTFANTIILGGEGRHQPNLTGGRAVRRRGDEHRATPAFEDGPQDRVVVGDDGSPGGT